MSKTKSESARERRDVATWREVADFLLAHSRAIEQRDEVSIAYRRGVETSSEMVRALAARGENTDPAERADNATGSTVKLGPGGAAAHGPPDERDSRGAAMRPAPVEGRGTNRQRTEGAARQGVETPGDGQGRSPLVPALGDRPAGRVAPPSASPAPDDEERAEMRERANAWLASRDEATERGLPKRRGALDRENELADFAISETAALRAELDRHWKVIEHAMPYIPGSSFVAGEIDALETERRALLSGVGAREEGTD